MLAYLQSLNDVWWQGKEGQNGLNIDDIIYRQPLFHYPVYVYLDRAVDSRLATRTRVATWVTFFWLATWLGTRLSWLVTWFGTRPSDSGESGRVTVELTLIPKTGSQPVTHLHQFKFPIENVWFKISRPSNKLNSKLILLLIGRFPVVHANITNLCYVSHLWLIFQ